MAKHITFNYLIQNGQDKAQIAQAYANSPLDGMEVEDKIAILKALSPDTIVINLWEHLKKNPNLGMSDIKKVNKSTVKFTRDLRSIGENLWDVTITRTPQGFHYHDSGSGSLIDIDFATADRLVWEFEYPKSLKKALKHLKPAASH